MRERGVRGAALGNLSNVALGGGGRRHGRGPTPLCMNLEPLHQGPQTGVGGNPPVIAEHH